MTTHRTSLFDDENNLAPTMVPRPGLFTTEQSEFGVSVKKL